MALWKKVASAPTLDATFLAEDPTFVIAGEHHLNPRGHERLAVEIQMWLGQQQML